MQRPTPAPPIFRHGADAGTAAASEAWEHGAVTMVETARGPIDGAALGRVLMHEHVFVISPEIQQNYPAEWGDDETRIAEAAERLTCLLYTSPSPRDGLLSRMPSSA